MLVSMPCFLSKVEATLHATLDVTPAFSESVIVFSILCLCRLCCILQYPQNHRKTTHCTRIAGGTPSFSACSDSAAPSEAPGLFSLLCLFGLCTADPPINHQRRYNAITFVKSSCQLLCVVLPCAVPAETSALVDLAGGAMVRLVPRSFQNRVNRTLHACSGQSVSLDR